MSENDIQNTENNCRIYYKCTVCGVLHDGKDGAPKSCIKCDNDKFYKVKRAESEKCDAMPIFTKNDV